MQADMHFSYKTAMSEIEAISCDFLKVKGRNIPVEFMKRPFDKDVRRADSGIVFYDPSLSNASAYISTMRLHNGRNRLTGKVRDEDFVNTVYAVLHESRHLWQYTELAQRPYRNETERKVMIDAMLFKAVPQMYYKCYNENVAEMDAYMFGLKGAHAYFKRYHPEVDVERHLCNIMNRNITTNHINREVHSFEEAISLFEKNMQRNDHKPVLSIMSGTNIRKEKGIVPAVKVAEPLVDFRLEKLPTLEAQKEELVMLTVKYGPEYMEYGAGLFMSQQSQRKLDVPESIMSSPEAGTDYDYT